MEISHQELQQRLTSLALCYALYERREETELTRAFLLLVVERHAKFHGLGTDWDQCKNQVCLDAKAVLEAARKPEVSLNPLTFELMRTYKVVFITEKVSGRVRAYLADVSSVAPTPPSPTVSLS